MKRIICTVGLPRSGKTTWAKKQGHPIVNPDSIRLALHGNRFIGLAEPFVWAIAYLMARALLLSGHDIVVVDATNITEKRRQAWSDSLQDIAEVNFFAINTSKEDCIRRAQAMNDEDIIPVIERMAESMSAKKK